jgi:hypothetical protein
VAGALLALVFGAGLTDDSCLRAPGFSQLAFASAALTQAIVVALMRIAAGARKPSGKAA